MIPNIMDLYGPAITAPDTFASHTGQHQTLSTEEFFSQAATGTRSTKQVTEVVQEWNTYCVNTSDAIAHKPA